MGGMAKRQTDGRNVKSVPSQAADGRSRAKDFLTEPEIATLLQAMKTGRHGGRDHLLALMTYRHGLRVSEAIGLRRDDVDLDHALALLSNIGWPENSYGGPRVDRYRPIMTATR